MTLNLEHYGPVVLVFFEWMESVIIASVHFYAVHFYVVHRSLCEIFDYINGIIFCRALRADGSVDSSLQFTGVTRLSFILIHIYVF